jgi:hypothetical protein
VAERGSKNLKGNTWEKGGAPRDPRLKKRSRDLQAGR